MSHRGALTDVADCEAVPSFLQQVLDATLATDHSGIAPRRLIRRVCARGVRGTVLLAAPPSMAAGVRSA